jgi:hypothetical protein
VDVEEIFALSAKVKKKRKELIANISVSSFNCSSNFRGIHKAAG